MRGTPPTPGRGYPKPFATASLRPDFNDPPTPVGGIKLNGTVNKIALLLRNNRGLHTYNRRQSFHNRSPGLAAIFRSKQLAAAGAEIETHRIQSIARQAIAQHCFKSILLRQAVGQSFP